MANIRKNLVGSVLLASGQFLAAGDSVPQGATVDPSLLEQDQPELDLGDQGDQGDEQADASTTSEVQADPGAADDAQADQGPAAADQADDEDDILGVPEPAAAEKPARKRSSRTRKAD